MLTYKRGKGVCNSDTKVVNMYHYYLKNRDSNKTISQPVFTKILNEFHEYKLNQAIYRNIEFDIPYIGKLYINRVEPRIVLKDSNIIIKLPINHKKTKELWEKDPIAKAIIEQVFAWVRADFPWLEKRYKITVTEDTPTLLKLVPLSSQEKKYVSHLYIAFTEDWVHVKLVEIHEKGGDYTRITFSNISLNRPLPKDIFKQ